MAINAGAWMKERGQSNVASMRLRWGIAARQNVGGLGGFRLAGEPFAWVFKTDWSSRTYSPDANSLDYSTIQYATDWTQSVPGVGGYEDLRLVIEYHWDRNFPRTDSRVHQSAAACVPGVGET